MTDADNGATMYFHCKTHWSQCVLIKNMRQYNKLVMTKVTEKYTK